MGLTLPPEFPSDLARCGICGGVTVNRSLAVLCLPPERPLPVGAQVRLHGVCRLHQPVAEYRWHPIARAWVREVRRYKNE